MKIALHKKTNSLPQVSTAALPDIVFILLFFFMTVTVMDNKNLLVNNNLPKASQAEKIALQNGVITIYIGKPIKKLQGEWGGQPKIQVANQFVSLSQLPTVVQSQLANMPAQLRQKAIVHLKVDQTTPMGVVGQVKEILQQLAISKISYGSILEG